jgi:hypothetical protein
MITMPHLCRTISLWTVELVDDNRILNFSHVEALKKESFCIARPTLHS